MTRALLVVGCGSVWLACSSYGGDDPASTPAPADAGSGAPVAVETPDAGAAGDAAPNAPGCPEKIVYVAPAPAGSDTNVGCDRGAPKASIGGALAYLKTLQIVDHEIRVCRGTYTEPGLVLDHPASIRGGYECSTFTRVAGFGFAGIDPTTGRALGFDKTNETVLDPGGTFVTLAIKGKAVTRDQRVEGMTVRGATTGGGFAILVSEGASPLITDDVIVGGGGGMNIGVGNLIGSIGVRVKDDAGAEITRSRINGGAGVPTTNPSIGSIGVDLKTSGLVSVHDNEIDGGSGMGSAWNAIGVHVDAPTTLTGANALLHNAIFFNGPNSNGVNAISPNAVEIVESSILGGSFSCVNVCAAYGVVAGGAGARVLRNRIRGATNTATSIVAASNCFGIVAAGTSTGTWVDSNLVDATASDSCTSAGIFGDPLSTDVRLTNNTVFGRGASVVGIGSFGANATIANNLIAGFTYGLSTGACTSAVATGSLPKAVTNNAFVGTPALARVSPPGSCDAAANDLTTLASTEAALGAGATNNVALLPACDAGEPAGRCRACTGECTGNVLPAAGLPELLAAGWPLPDTAWCKITNGGLDLGPAVDAAGTSRTLPFSIGAREKDTTTCVP